MQVYEELQARGLLAQVTDEKEIRELDTGNDKTLLWLMGWRTIGRRNHCQYQRQQKVKVRTCQIRMI